MAQQWQFTQRSNADQVVSGHQLQGTKVIVTGANTGIGFETARALASVGATVMLACRNTTSGNAAVAKIKQQHSGADVSCRELDLASLDNVVAFCQQLDWPQIDLLICNAGSMSTSYQQTQQGFERTFGVCHVGHFLLTQQLLPKLLKTGNARVIMLSSEAHRSPKKLDFERLPYSQDDYSIMKAYGQAKLCNALMALELQARYGEQGLTACSVHPGNMVTTDFGRESAVMRLLFKVLSPLTKTANQGAATTVVCALHEPASDIAGLYFSHCKPHRCTSESRDAAVAAKLWQHSEAMVSDWL